MAAEKGEAVPVTAVSDAESATSGSRMIRLKSSDEQMFEVSVKAARLSKLIANVLEGLSGADDTISILKVDSKTLAKVIRYCNKHADSAADDKEEEDLKTWEKEFLDELQKDTASKSLHEVLLAAHFLEIDGLLDITCKRIADMIKGKTAQEIREILKIKNDFTPQEEEEIRSSNRWAFEP